jgi:hypothetical protein
MWAIIRNGKGLISPDSCPDTSSRSRRRSGTRLAHHRVHAASRSHRCPRRPSRWPDVLSYPGCGMAAQASPSASQCQDASSKALGKDAGYVLPRGAVVPNAIRHDLSIGRSCRRRLQRGDTGHIGGTSTRDLPESVENCRDRSSRAGGMRRASTEVGHTPTQDPAYRPTRPPAST